MGTTDAQWRDAMSESLAEMDAILGDEVEISGLRAEQHRLGELLRRLDTDNGNEPLLAAIEADRLIRTMYVNAKRLQEFGATRGWEADTSAFDTALKALGSAIQDILEEERKKQFSQAAAKATRLKK